jgi:hypothetical protein
MTAVEPVPGSPSQFLVASRTGATRYLVDLAEYSGNGQCGCAHFEFRLRPELERGARPSWRLRCWHIREALLCAAALYLAASRNEESRGG